jgi:hypothetical protein
MEGKSYPNVAILVAVGVVEMGSFGFCASSTITITAPIEPTPKLTLVAILVATVVEMVSFGFCAFGTIAIIAPTEREAKPMTTGVVSVMV